MNETVVTRSNLDRANWAKSLDKAIWGGALSRHFAGQRSGNQKIPRGRKNNARSRNPKASGPNTVVVVWNDTGFSDIRFLASVFWHPFSDIGCYGSEIETPNLDHLAAGGIRFIKFHNNAKTYVTGASLTTGLEHQQPRNVHDPGNVTPSEVL